jgi:hypothetical protein
MPRRFLAIYDLEMADPGIRAHQIRVLAGVAGYLASAIETVSYSECKWVASEIVEVLAVVEDLIDVLEKGTEVPTSRLGLLLAANPRGSS